MSAEPRPIKELATLAPLDGLLFDIDDTLTLHGKLVPPVFDALAGLRARGLKIIPVTGRPAGWVDHIARMWPVDAVVGENGGLWFWYDDEARRLERRFLQDAETRAANRLRLEGLAEQILAEVPGVALASDQGYRALDLAIDFCEDVPPQGDEAIDRVVALFEAAGAVCKVSSIHVNGWFGDFDKLTGIRRLHLERWGQPLDPQRWAWFGDSANDEPMFEAFPLSIGVANVRRFLPRMKTGPAWITEAEGGEGVVEALAWMERLGL